MRQLGWGRMGLYGRAALVLAAAQMATALAAVALAAVLAYDQGMALAANSLRLRLDGLAEEIEQRASLEGGPANLPPALRLDLAARFPDPLYLLDAEGRVALTVGAEAAPPRLPAGLAALLDAGDIALRTGGGGWGLAPLYTPDGALAGGVLVQPLAASLERELSGAREALLRALVWILALAFLTALGLAAALAGPLVRPLRSIIGQVERIGAGDYGARLEVRRADEIGRLAAAVNRMAAAVAGSIDELKAADALRRELVANVGHDLRTPLAALQGYVEEAGRLLREGRPEAARAALEGAERKGARLRTLVGDLFELSVLDRGAPALRREPVPLAELLTEAAGAHAPLFARAGVALETALEPGLPVVHADGVRLLRLLDNLLDNARRHTPPGGRVRLEASAEPGEACIAVEDTGAGMSPETLQRVFDRYYRGREARTSTGEGAGLGLAISLAIARAHGGALEAYSRLGEGSRFVLRLPLAETPAPENASP